MKVALLGGVFDDPMGGLARSAPENVLRRFLTEAGQEVVPLSVHRSVPLGAAADVYHGNHYGLGSYHLALAGARPFVFTSHDPFLASGQASSGSRLEHELQRLVLRSADAIVALSSREADLLAARFGVAPSRFEVIPNGLDLDLYDRSEPPGGETLELLSVGQLVEYKGHGFLLDAVAELAAAGTAVRLTLVSHRPALRERYEARARALGIADRVRFDGPLDTLRLVERYRACDVYVQPSLAESFGVTIAEAMACGRPVVATDVGGVPEVVGEAGLLVPAADARALAGAIRRLADDPAERRRLGELACARAHASFDGRTMAARYAALYARVATGRPRSPAATRRAAAALALRAYERRGALAALVPERVRQR